MLKTLTIDLDSDGNTLSYELRGNEKLAVSTEQNGARLYLNKAACELLATVLAKMAFGPYEPGFHVHFKQDFGEEPRPDILSIVRQ